MISEKIPKYLSKQSYYINYLRISKVQIIGSHAAMTCQIVVMRHTESGVASLGHFDNFSCWQFGDCSPHKEGLQTMIDEIEHLSKDDLDKGHIQVSVFGGYVDK